MGLEEKEVRYEIQYSRQYQQQFTDNNYHEIANPSSHKFYKIFEIYTKYIELTC